MGDTTIEWADKSWNPVTGCTKVSAGCAHCYAERVFPRAYGRERKFTDVRTHPERLEQPLHWKKPQRIFVNSMSDLFHPDVPLEFIARVWGTMYNANHHTYQILTKRPEGMLRWFQDGRRQRLHWSLIEGVVLRNVWLGVSVEDQKTADERILLLLKTPAAVRFVSYEPALGEVDFMRWLGKFGLDWIIAGGESGPGARISHFRWFQSVRDQCRVTHTPFFFKQWGEYSPLGKRVGKKAAGRLLDGREWNEFPAPGAEV